MRAKRKNQLILFNTQDQIYGALLDLTLREYGYRVRKVGTFENLGLIGLTVPTIAWFIDLDHNPHNPQEIADLAKNEAPDARLVFMGSHFTLDQVKACQASQAIAVLSKPFHISRLVQTISLIAQEPVFIEREEVPQPEETPPAIFVPIDHRPYLRKVRLVCPVCTHIFDTDRFKLWVFPVSDTDSDFCPICPDAVHPELYSVMVCPKCLFAFYVGKFSSVKMVEERRKRFLNPVLLEERRKVAINLNYQEERTLLHGVKSFELAALTCDQLQMTERTRLMAEFFLKSSWLCRRMNHALREKEAQEKALECFIRIYQPYSNFPMKGMSGRHAAIRLTAKREPVDDRQVLVAGFLIGELSRRLGLKQQARRYYEDVLRSPNLSRYSSLMGHFHETHREFLKALELDAQAEAETEDA